MLDKIKEALRIKNTTAFDSEITDLISAAKADLVLSGILESKISDTDPLIIRSIILYAKSHFGIDNTESEKYQAAYNSLKTHLCLSSEYTEAVV
jgi:uncharacterized phage protein (predicted DNA packaging)